MLSSRLVVPPVDRHHHVRVNEANLRARLYVQVRREWEVFPGDQRAYSIVSTRMMSIDDEPRLQDSSKLSDLTPCMGRKTSKEP